MSAAVVGQVDLPAGGAILNPGWTPTPHPRGSVGVVTVHSSSRGSPRRLARDVGGEHVGRLGVARRLVVGRLPAALALVALEVTLLVLLAALFLD